MRLFLSSYQAGNHAESLTKLFGEGSEVAVITNAKDHKSPIERQQSVNEIIGYLSGLAMNPVELDLRDYFNDPANLEKRLKESDALWVAGGNTFILRRALAYSGGDKVLNDLVNNDAIAYGGESAGAVLAAPTLTGVEFGDNPSIVPEGYREGVIWDGLEFVPYHIVPHYQSEWEGAQPMIDTLVSKNLPYKTLTNDQAIVVDGDQEEFLA